MRKDRSAGGSRYERKIAEKEGRAEKDREAIEDSLSVAYSVSMWFDQAWFDGEEYVEPRWQEKRWVDAPDGWYTYGESEMVYTGPFPAKEDAEQFLVSRGNETLGYFRDMYVAYREGE